MKSGRYQTLDAARGLAAIAVALFHYQRSLAPYGYLAVDFFFALSGFVLATVYADKPQTGFWSFMRDRWVRLYPVYLVGLGIGGMYGAQLIVRNIPGHLDWGTLGSCLALSTTALPCPATPDLFQFNPALWSVSFEFVLSASFGLGLARVSTPVLAAVLFALGMLLAHLYGAPLYGDYGSQWSTLAPGLVRAIFSFALGILISRAPKGERQRTALCVLPLACMMVAYLWIGYDHGGPLIWTLALSPALLYIMGRLEPPRQLSWTAEFLGDVSYPLYAVNFPVVFLVHAISARTGLPMAAQVVLLIACLLTVPVGILHFFDAPVRQWLGRRVGARVSAPPQVA